jgi:putative SOS response-associated peptidase YedK
MCGRYALSRLPSELVEEFELSADRTKGILPVDWNITPTRDIYIIKNNKELHTASWGLIAPWSKDREQAVKSQSQAINARIETVHEKPTFRNAFKSKRCLIPATGYYEWATELGYPNKQPFFIHSTKRFGERDQTLLFAGIYDRWVDANGEIFESAAIITRPAISFLEKIHNRMPTFLPEERYSDWLNPEINDVSEIRKLMEVADPVANLAAHPVAKHVNSTRNNGPDLIAPIELPEPETLF